MVDNKTIFGNRLRELRKEKGLTVTELAKRFDVATSTLSRYETNLMNPTRDFQLKCADFFNCSIDYLNGLSNVKTVNSSQTNEEFNPKLTKKDVKRIENLLSNTLTAIESQNSFMACGDVLNEDMDIIKDVLKEVLENSILENKRKFTPNKYRDK